jgi:hypothetical protein
MNTYGGVDVLIQVLLTSALDGGKLSGSRPGRFTPGEGAPIPTGYEAGWAPEPIWTAWSG